MYPKNPLVQKIQNIVQNSNYVFVFIWIPSHVSIEGNEKADKLAKESICEQTTQNFQFINQDLKNIIKHN